MSLDRNQARADLLGALRVFQAEVCAYGTREGDGRRCDCKFLGMIGTKPGSEQTGCAEARTLIAMLAAIASDAPASKPLVVGQKYKLGELPVGAKFHHQADEPGNEPTTIVRHGKPGERSPCAGPFAEDFVVHDTKGWDYATTVVTLVSLPSAKADGGKAMPECPDCGSGPHSGCRPTCDGVKHAVDCAWRKFHEPATPPALTREEVVEIAKQAAEDRIQRVQRLKLKLSDDGKNRLVIDVGEWDGDEDLRAIDVLRAALSEGGAR